MNSPVPTNWRDFFDLQAPTYDQNAFTKNSAVEVQFILDQVPLAAGARVLDMGCGTGRHLLPFMEKGLEAVGIDFSPEMIRMATEKVDRAGYKARLEVADVRVFEESGTFDLVVCLCEGPINLVGHDEDAVSHALAIFRKAASNLKLGGHFVFTALNAYAQIRHLKQEDADAGAFDPVTMVAQYANEMNTPVGPQTLLIRERLFLPPEITAMLYHSGFDLQKVLGGTAGEWDDRPLRLDEIEALYIAKKRT